MMRLAVVGTGMLVRELLPVFREMDCIRVQALCATARSGETARALGRQYGVAPELVFTDYAAMLAQLRGQIDAVYIATPNDTHYALAREALESGHAVILEKPLVLRYEEGQALYELARRKGVPLLEAISNQYLPSFAALRGHLPDIGEVRHVRISYAQYSSRYDRFLAGEYFRVFDAARGGGALNDLGIYNIHAAVGLFGAPASAVYYPNVVRGVDTSGVLLMDYGSFKCVCHAAKDCEGESGIRIEGTRGSLRADGRMNAMKGDVVYEDPLRGVVRTYEIAQPAHRVMPEFEAFDRMLTDRDPERLRELQEAQEESLRALRVLTARADI